jgi:hypothetical protein
VAYGKLRIRPADFWEMMPWELECACEGAIEEDRRVRADGALRALAIVRGFASEKINLRQLWDFMMHESSGAEVDQELLAESKARADAAELEKVGLRHGREG